MPVYTEYKRREKIPDKLSPTHPEGSVYKRAYDEKGKLEFEEDYTPTIGKG